MIMFTLTGFSDEISRNIDEQIISFQNIGLNTMEIRNINGKNKL